MTAPDAVLVDELIAVAARWIRASKRLMNEGREREAEALRRDALNVMDALTIVTGSGARLFERLNATVEGAA
jgi:hypothetical protein